MNENETAETTPAAELEASALNNLVIPFYVLAVWGDDGSYDCTVVCELCDMIYISVQDIDGTKLFFESEAYHLNKWCAENGLKYKCVKDHYTLEV